MNLEGYHVTEHKNHLGYRASPSDIERGRPVEARLRDAWKYHDSIPNEGKRDRYFYSYEDLEHLTTWDQAEVKRKYLTHKWRWRLDNTTKERQFYLMDIIVSVLSYVESWPGQRLDQGLLTEARDRRATPSQGM